MTQTQAHQHILVLGVGPLPVDGQNRLFAPGLRTWQLADVLCTAGHEICIGAIDFGAQPSPTDAAGCCTRHTTYENMTIWHLLHSPDDIIQFLTQQHNANPFNAVVSTTDIMNGLASQLPFDVPQWLDYNGDVFAEKQMMGKVYGNDATLFDQWKLLLQGLRRGDRFSTCSPNQTHAMLGQLGFAGRLNQFTAGEQLVHTLLPCSRIMVNLPQISVPELRGNKLPEDAFIVFWMGGYNSWTDPEMLFLGMEQAMLADPTIYYVSTGGPLEGHNTATFTEFYRRIEASPLKNRFYFTGWIPTEEVPSYAKQANLAINIDAPSVEAQLGYRNRVIDWILFKLPIASTTESHITHTLAQQNVMYRLQTGNPQSLCDTVLHVRNNPTEATEQAERAYQWLDENLTDEKFAALIQWCNTPTFAGDHLQERQSNVTRRHAELLAPIPDPAPSLLRRILRKIKRIVLCR